MAFFGLTALGPQNSFASASRYLTHLYVFEEKDFERIWKATVGDEKHCLTSKIPDMMRVLYRGPVPENDLIRISNAFSEFEGEYTDTISYYLFMQIMLKLRQDAEEEEKSFEGRQKPTVDFTSSWELQTAIRQNKKMSKTLQDKQNAPLTAQQELGWERQTLVKPVAGREGSDITKFAAELVKNGIYY